MGCVQSGDERSAELVEASTILAEEDQGGHLGRSLFVLDHPGCKILDFYTLDSRVLGKGAYGCVRTGTSKTTSAIRAVKVVPNTRAKGKYAQRLRREVCVMKHLDHPNIVKLHETFHDSKNTYLVMEVCKGGDLMANIFECGKYTEVEAAHCMKQLLQAVSYLHEHRFCHRDLKPENCLFTSRAPIKKNHLKIIDFGLSRSFEPGEMFKTKLGTPYYVAPQVLFGSYDYRCDLWSCGAILYLMLSNVQAFSGETDDVILSKVRRAEYSLTGPAWNNVSENAKMLIRNLLKMSDSERYTAKKALDVEWLKEKAPKALQVELGPSFVDRLRTFQSENLLKRTALNIIAGELTEDLIKPLRDTFIFLDKDGDGALTADEMQEALMKDRLSQVPTDLHQIVADVDWDRSGAIDYTEFLAAILDRSMYLKEPVCLSAFQTFDRDGDGKISVEELQYVLSGGGKEHHCTGESMATLLQHVDRNGDNAIDFEEFLEMMRAQKVHK